MSSFAWMLALGSISWLALSAPAPAQVVFGPPVHSQLADSSGALSFADLNGDGALDALTCQSSGTKVAFGDGRGHFATQVPTSPSPLADSGKAADLDGDGLPELITVGPAANPKVLSVLKGLPGGAFAPPVTYPLSNGVALPTCNVEVSDADGDGDTDVLAFVNKLVATGSKLWLCLNDGTGVLSPEVVTSDEMCIVPSAADLDGDGLVDVVTGVDFSWPPAAAAIKVFRGLAGGGFAVGQTWAGLRIVALTDVNGDGRPDVVAMSSSDVQSLLGQGDGTFVAGPVTPLAQFVVAVADFDGDGAQDLLTFAGADSAYNVFRGDGTGAFATRPAATIDFGVSDQNALVADVVPDGRPDIVGEGITVWPNLTYPIGGPLLDLGHGLAGAEGTPGMLGVGAFIGSDAVAFNLWHAAYGPAQLVAGSTEIFAPFAGGVLVPSPDVILGPVPITGNGTAQLTGHWPPGVPAGTSLTFQWWTPDSTAVHGKAASTAVRVTAP